jgi:hypothetical protein
MEHDYVTDTPYIANFHPDLSPVALNLIAATNGVAPRPLTQPFTYCELGCGHGLSTNILAACFPQGVFFGVDLMSVHIQSAERLAAAGELDNVTFLECDFGKLAAAALPQCDFIVLHGVYSWIGETVQQSIRDFIRSQLKPGGLVYISYNAMPGWSALLPMRDMMLAYTSQLPGDSTAKAQHGLGYLEYLHKNGAEYFVKTPNAVATLERLKQHPINYVIHEYFHPFLTPMYFFEVAKEMREAGCEFIGNSLLRDNFASLALPPQFQELARTLPSRAAFEVHKDFVRNTQFRQDVFVKQDKPVLASSERARLAEELHFGPPIRLPGSSPLNLTGPIFAPLAAVLGDRAISFAELRESSDLIGFSARELWEAVLGLVINQQALPYARSTPPILNAGVVRPERPALAFQSPFNRIVLEEMMSERSIMAAPALGNGISLSGAEALAILALTQVPQRQAADWGCDYLERHNRPLVHEGTRVNGREATRQKLQESVETFATQYLAKFIQLGLVQEASE